MDCNYAKGVKQGTAHSLAVNFSSDCDEFSLDSVERIDFVFKQQRSKDAPAIKTAVWDAQHEDGAVRIPDTNTISVAFSEEETYRFKAGKTFYMDTRIFVENSNENPATAIVELMMNDTLFGEDEE